MKAFTALRSLTEHALRALLVSALESLASLITLVGVRLYARGLLSRGAIRALLGFASVLHRSSLRLLRSAKP